jgi:hypothetical protein
MRFGLSGPPRWIEALVPGLRHSLVRAAPPQLADATLAKQTMLHHDGHHILPAVIPLAQVTELIAALSEHANADAIRRRNARTYAMRDLLRLVPAVRELAEGAAIRSLIDPILGPNARPVRGLLFDKTPDANWKVAWHQDLSIAVKEKHDAPGYGPWSVKAGVPHVQPPLNVLQNMLTVRLHLDDCGPDNGPLRVLRSSHAHGILSPAQIEAWRARSEPRDCLVPAGGMLLMRPLILHASSPAARPEHRRVIHVEFSSAKLAPNLEWYET